MYTAVVQPGLTTGWMFVYTIRVQPAKRGVIDKSQRVLNAVASVITGTRKFDRGLGKTLRDELHWLHVPDRVFLKLDVTVHRCKNGRSPPYLMNYYIPVSGADIRRHPRSANRRLLAVPCFRLNTYEAV